MTIVYSNPSEILKTLLLPIAPDMEEKGIQAVKNYLQNIGINENEQPIWLKLRIDQWQEENDLDPKLMELIIAYLKESHDDFGPLIAKYYFPFHKILIEEYSCSHQEASSFISYSFQILNLAKNHSMSASQISNVIISQAKNDKFTWEPVQRFLIKFGIIQSISIEKTKALFKHDEEREERELADADLTTSVNIISEIASKLGFLGDLKSHLQTLYGTGKAHVPYLQMLHYICSTAHFYDNAISYLYEFSPRGKHANWLFDQYSEKGFEVAKNAVLNNAKSVNRLDINWANSKKKKERLKARAIVHIIEDLEKMGFSQRKELAGWIRLWLHRVMRLNQTVRVKDLLSIPSTKELKNIFERVSKKETNTKGIIEQRIADAITNVLHSKKRSWHSRGLGDSVNASNASRKKFGDCEFLNPLDKKIFAYEAHAGILTKPYIDDHVRSIKKVLELRKDELESIAEISTWQLKMVFIAHETTHLTRWSETINNLNTDFKILRFEELVNKVEYDIALSDSFKEYVIQILNENRTPNSVRKVFKELYYA